jgi:hypothetical protein
MSLHPLGRKSDNLDTKSLQVPLLRDFAMFLVWHLKLDSADSAEGFMQSYFKFTIQKPKGDSFGDIFVSHKRLREFFVPIL